MRIDVVCPVPVAASLTLTYNHIKQKPRRSGVSWEVEADR